MQIIDLSIHLSLSLLIKVYLSIYSVYYQANCVLLLLLRNKTFLSYYLLTESIKSTCYNILPHTLFPFFLAFSHLSFQFSSLSLILLFSVSFFFFFFCFFILLLLFSFFWGVFFTWLKCLAISIVAQFTLPLHY